MTTPDPTVQAVFSITSELGIASAFAENIAASRYTSGTGIAQMWRESSGHYANMINSNYTKVGIGYYAHDGWVYAVQLFR